MRIGLSLSLSPTFPLPVCANPIISLPFKATGILSTWIAVGKVNPSFSVASTNSGISPNSSKVVFFSSCVSVILVREKTWMLFYSFFKTLVGSKVEVELKNGKFKSEFDCCTLDCLIPESICVMYIH